MGERGEVGPGKGGGGLPWRPEPAHTGRRDGPHPAGPGTGGRARQTRRPRANEGARPAGGPCRRSNPRSPTRTGGRPRTPSLDTLPAGGGASLPGSGSRAANALQPDTFPLGNGSAVCAEHPKRSAPARKTPGVTLPGVTLSVRGPRGVRPRWPPLAGMRTAGARGDPVRPRRDAMAGRPPVDAIRAA